jgi:hypothetical protein
MVWRKRFRRARRVGSKSESGTRCRQSLLTPWAEMRVLRERWGYICRRSSLGNFKEAVVIVMRRKSKCMQARCASFFGE